MFLLSFFLASLQLLLIVFLLWLGILSAQNNTYQIYGFIADSESGEVLIGANVFIQETGKGMATDINGYYVFITKITSFGIYNFMLLNIIIFHNNSV